MFKDAVKICLCACCLTWRALGCQQASGKQQTFTVTGLCDGGCEEGDVEL